MEKNSILTLLFLLSIATFVQSQDKAHTQQLLQNWPVNSFDSRFMEDLIAENPFLYQSPNYYSSRSTYQFLPENNSMACPAIHFRIGDNFRVYLEETAMKTNFGWNSGTPFDVSDNPLASLLFEAGRNLAIRINDN